MINHLRNGVGTAANGGFIPQGLPNHTSYKDSTYNLKLAKNYLQSSHIKNTKPITLTTTSNYLDLCILVQKNCAEIGIEIKIDVIPASLLKQQKSTGELIFFRSSWIADYPDGENFMTCFYGPNKAPNGPNYTRYSNLEFDQEYASLMSVTDPIKKEKLINKMENILHDDQPFILLFYDESIWLKNKKVDQIKINALNHLDLRQAEVKS
jgi:peptide/nickel transport system substrate-binding protein